MGPIELFAQHINEFVSPEAKDNFLSMPIIKGSIPLQPFVQRLTINNTLRSLLYAHSGRTGLEVTPVVSWIIDDAELTTWLDILDRQVLSYIKEHKILG